MAKTPDYPVVKYGDPMPDLRQPPKPIEYAVWKDGDYSCWKVDGEYKVYQFKKVKIRRPGDMKSKKPGPIEVVGKECVCISITEIPSDKTNDLEGAIKFHSEGITA